MIDYWFPTPIMREDVSAIFDKAYNQKCYELILAEKEKQSIRHEWNCETFSTYMSFELKDEPHFKRLIDLCTDRVKSFAQSFGHDKGVKYHTAWGNIAEPGQYQEKHLHPHSHFSLIYYVKCEEDCGDTIFFSPYENDMFTLPVEKVNTNSYSHCFYKPIEGNLLIFRSNVIHMVRANKSGTNRCTLAMNFTCE